MPWSVRARIGDRCLAQQGVECRNCHDYDSMGFPEQGRRAVTQHSTWLEEGETSIDSHKGIAHSLPYMHEVDPTVVVGG